MKRKISREMTAGPVYIAIAKEGPVGSHGKKDEAMGPTRGLAVLRFLRCNHLDIALFSILFF
jgi:hypothetical protein